MLKILNPQIRVPSRPPPYPKPCPLYPTALRPSAESQIIAPTIDPPLLYLLTLLSINVRNPLAILSNQTPSLLAKMRRRMEEERPARVESRRGRVGSSTLPTPTSTLTSTSRVPYLLLYHLCPSQHHPLLPSFAGSCMLDFSYFSYMF